MGSMRTWSLAVLACIFVAIVARQGSNADAGASNALPAAPTAVPASPPPLSGSRVTGLPDFSGLVAENGAAVVNISVVEKPQKLDGGAGGGEQGDDDPLSQFFHRFQDAQSRPPASGARHRIGVHRHARRLRAHQRARRRGCLAR